MDNILSLFYVTFIFDNRWQFFANGLLMTLILTISSFILGSIIGALFCRLRFSKNKIIIKLANILNAFLVQLPTLVLLMVFVYIIFSKTSLSAVIIVIFGLTLKTASYMSDIFYTAVVATNSGEAEAARALGMNKYQSFVYITLPQAIQNSLAVYKNQFISTLQETSIVGSLAIQELTKASTIVTSRTLNAFFSLISISILYILIGVVGTSILNLIGKTKHIGDNL